MILPFFSSANLSDGGEPCQLPAQPDARWEGRTQAEPFLRLSIMARDTVQHQRSQFELDGIADHLGWLSRVV